MRHGEVNSNNDVSGKSIRVGLVTTAVIDGVTKAVTFSSAMPTTDYHIFLQAQSNLGVTAWPTVKTVNGFTLNVSVAVAGDTAYVAVEY